MLPFLQDSYDLGGLHLSNARLCLRTPDYGSKLPGRKTSDVFQHLTESFPVPPDADRVQFEHCLSEVSLLISGLLEYQALSKSVLSGKFLDLYFFFLIVFFRHDPIFDSQLSDFTRLPNHVAGYS